ncbi:electron transport complex subunit RsxC [Thalassotalea euphylliae]|uniref:electron transport complex subunit RsxC n=1 Tax=Thalassotalea euphylliae TaxID=1655234 RepID=UPI00362F1E3B
MQDIIQRIDNNQFWKFHGGIHPPEQKFLTNDKPIRPLHLPEQLVIPVQQHIGVPGDLLVKPGDKVLKGQALTAPSTPMAVPIHAPTSGKIDKIDLHVIAHPSGLSELCVFMTPDHEETWRERHICQDFTDLSRHDIIKRIANAGISGMGGAGFPTHIKVDSKPDLNFLIINAAECEPYITADDLLMQEHSVTISQGISILRHLLEPKVILIGIEDNKPKAIEAIREATKHLKEVRVCVTPTQYPMGGEKQLIKVLTGKEIPSGSLPSQHGIVMQNVATCFAIAEAVIHDIPLIKRVVTITGQGLDKPQNMWAALGTPVKDLISYCGNNQSTSQKAVIMGGPMMGFTLPTDRVPVVKITNCVLVPSNRELNLNNKEVECIRCGQCAEVCPSQLLPQELQWSAKAKDHDKLKALNLFDCIDCGACAYVCPSHIPLVQYYRVAKAEIREQELMDVKAEKAKARFEARKARLEREKQAREEKQRKASEARKAAMNSTPEGQGAKSAVAAALARVKAKKAQQDESEPTNTAQPVSNTKSAAAAAIARAKAKKAAKAAEQNKVSENSVNKEQSEPSQAADVSDKAGVSKDDRVAAAIARAKAKKAANKTAAEIESRDSNAQSTAVQSNVEETPTKEKRVSAAIAKAKAKKAAQKASKDGETDTQSATAAETEKSEQTPTKEKRVSAAIAKAKAKKAAQKANVDANPDEQATIKADVDKSENSASKEKRVAAAIAKAKAKKANKSAKSEVTEQASKGLNETVAAEQTQTGTGNTNATVKQVDTESSDDTAAKPSDKKARIAAAVAKAKAKKQAQSPEAVSEPATTESSDVEDTQLAKKARIAAAVAKAKAKKQQQTESK